jgi:hypothetical protein
MPVAAIGSAVIGAGSSIFGASQQADAAKAGIQAQQQMYGQGLSFAQQQAGNAASTLNPFISAGQTALGQYQQALPGLTKPFDPSMLSQTPGYQFTLGQGLKSTQNSFAAQGLGSSGAALKGAAAYSTGLAQNTYNQQFQNYLEQNSQIGNLLYQPVNAGVSAAGQLAGAYSQLGTAGLGGAVSTGQGVASSLAGYGNALAGGAAGVSNSLSSGLQNYQLYSLLQGGGLGGLGGGVNYGALSGPAYGGGNIFTDAYGGSPTNPLAGLTSEDYG